MVEVRMIVFVMNEDDGVDLEVVRYFVDYIVCFDYFLCFLFVIR